MLLWRDSRQKSDYLQNQVKEKPELDWKLPRAPCIVALPEQQALGGLNGLEIWIDPIRAMGQRCCCLAEMPHRLLCWVIWSQTHQCIQGRKVSSWLCKLCNDMAPLQRTMWETNYCLYCTQGKQLWLSNQILHHFWLKNRNFFWAANCFDALFSAAQRQ